MLHYTCKKEKEKKKPSRKGTKNTSEKKTGTRTIPNLAITYSYTWLEYLFSGPLTFSPSHSVDCDVTLVQMWRMEVYKSIFYCFLTRGYRHIGNEPTLHFSAKSTLRPCKMISGIVQVTLFSSLMKQEPLLHCLANSTVAIFFFFV